MEKQIAISQYLDKNKGTYTPEILTENYYINIADVTSKIIGVTITVKGLPDSHYHFSVMTLLELQEAVENRIDEMVWDQLESISPAFRFFFDREAARERIEKENSRGELITGIQGVVEHTEEVDGVTYYIFCL